MENTTIGPFYFFPSESCVNREYWIDSNEKGENIS